VGQALQGHHHQSGALTRPQKIQPEGRARPPARDAARDQGQRPQARRLTAAFQPHYVEPEDGRTQNTLRAAPPRSVLTADLVKAYIERAAKKVA
jgi:hypothetical protein